MFDQNLLKPKLTVRERHVARNDMTVHELLSDLKQFETVMLDSYDKAELVRMLVDIYVDRTCKNAPDDIKDLHREAFEEIGFGDFTDDYIDDNNSIPPVSELI